MSKVDEAQAKRKSAQDASDAQVGGFSIGGEDV